MEIDGSVLEGGGQILRIALSLSCILRTPIRIFNIRAGRPKPGLGAQHLKGVELLRDMTAAKVMGAGIGSTELEFRPIAVKGGKYYADTGTAGSIALLLQVSLPVAHFSNSETILDLKGGTNAAMAPQIDFLTEIFRPNLEKFGVSFDFDLFKRGYYPRGGGHCQIQVKPVKQVTSCNIVEFGTIEKFFGWSFVAGTLPIKLAYEMTDGAKSHLGQFNTPTEIESYKESRDVANSNCSGIILGCETSTGCLLGGSALGSSQERGFDTGKKAATEVGDCVRKKACIDSFVQDQLIIYMALANGTSSIKTTNITLHTKTAIHVVELMTKAKFHIKENQSEGSCILECCGIGIINNEI